MNTFSISKQKFWDIFFPLLAVIVLLLALSIWPLGILPVRQEWKALEAGMAQSGTITETTPLSGIVQIPSGKLTALSIRFSIPNRRDNTGILHFQLKDAQGSILVTEDVALCDMKNNQYYRFSLPKGLTAGQPYLFEITVTDTAEDFPTFWLGSPQTAARGSLAVYYCGQALPNNALMMQLTVSDAASFKQSLPYEITLLALAILILYAWKGVRNP